ncbi:MAG: YvcK family protein [Actinobacteria bacterium]|nr:YvcK family protein [Actinomycetota bacterium]
MSPAPPGQGPPLGDGPRVVALGGGHGTAVTLQALRRYAGDIAAIVSVADDGGSSGRLRAAFGIPAPGDLRRCLAALSDPAQPLARAFEHRFESGDVEGHTLGNLVIAGLTVATGSFTAALEEAGRLLGAVGRVLPATVEPVVLKAVAEGGEVEGQVAVARAGRISSVSIVPPDAAPPEEALEAIAAADQLVIGPGSLFTSVLAVVSVPAIREALQRASGPKVYVCNLQASSETRDFDVARHVDALIAHGLEPDVVLYDPSTISGGDCRSRLVAAPLARRDRPDHDPERLARALAALVG